MRKFLYSLTLAAAAATLVACGGGGESGGANPNQPNLMTTAGSSVVIPVNAVQRYQISGGVPPYRVGNSNEMVAVGAIQGSELHIGGRAGGTSTVTVYDYSGSSIATEVQVTSSTVPLYTTAPGSITVGVGESASRTFTIGGGSAPYTVVGSDSNVARIERVGTDQWRVTGIAMGESTVQIRDAAGTIVEVGVAVGAPELRLGMEDLVMPVGLEAVVKITGGQPPYRVGGGIPAAIHAEVVGDELRLRGLLASELDISVMDSAGQSAVVSVEINTGTTSFRFSPGAIVVSEEDTQQLLFTAFDGVGEVCYFSSNPSLLRPLVNGCTTERQIVVDTGTSGSRCVDGDTEVRLTAVDANRSVATATILVTNSNPVPCNQAPLSVDSRTLEVSAGAAVQTAVRNAFGVVSAASSNTAVATVNVLNGVLTVQGVGAGQALITVWDEGRRTITLNVKVN